MKFEFMVDDITSTAVMVGNGGMSPIDVHVGRLGLTFMEKLSADDPARRSHSLGGSSSSALRRGRKSLYAWTWLISWTIARQRSETR